MFRKELDIIEHAISHMFFIGKQTIMHLVKNYEVVTEPTIW